MSYYKGLGQDESDTGTVPVRAIATPRSDLPLYIIGGGLALLALAGGKAAEHHQSLAMNKRRRRVRRNAKVTRGHFRKVGGKTVWVKASVQKAAPKKKRTSKKK